MFWNFKLIVWYLQKIWHLGDRPLGFREFPRYKHFKFDIALINFYHWWPFNLFLQSLSCPILVVKLLIHNLIFRSCPALFVLLTLFVYVGVDLLTLILRDISSIYYEFARFIFSFVCMLSYLLTYLFSLYEIGFLVWNWIPCFRLVGRGCHLLHLTKDVLLSSVPVSPFPTLQEQ